MEGGAAPAAPPSSTRSSPAVDEAFGTPGVRAHHPDPHARKLLGCQVRYRITPLNEIFTLPVALSKLPLNDKRPRAPANAAVPPVTVAVPEKDTLLPAPAAHAWA